MKPFVWSESFTIHAYESDADGKATIAGLLNHTQEAAGNHAELLGLSVYQLLPKGLTWVLSRIILTMHRYPAYRERIRLETWPAGVDRFMALRDFELFDAQETLIASMRTQWVMVDLKTMRPVALPAEVHAIAAGNNRFALPLESPRVSRLEGCGTFSKVFPVRRSEIDLNQHVNNVHYLVWALESVPDGLVAGKRPAHVDLVFKSETRYGDTVCCLGESADGESDLVRHRIERIGDGKDVFLALTKWQ